MGQRKDACSKWSLARNEAMSAKGDRSGKVGLYNPSHDPDAQHVAAGFDVFPARF